MTSLQILRLQDRQRAESQRTGVSEINAENPELGDDNDYAIDEDIKTNYIKAIYLTMIW
mgnify:CR=1 FL=1|tara:strand:- start:782 stop:958 length:177 start_codon:yes stop_codon:yes gene_type:complete